MATTTMKIFNWAELFAFIAQLEFIFSFSQLNAIVVVNAMIIVGLGGWRFSQRSSFNSIQSLEGFTRFGSVFSWLWLKET